MQQVLQAQSNYEPLRLYTLQHPLTGWMNQPIPQHNDDGSSFEQQLGEMNVARGRAIEAIGNRLELAQERGDEVEVIALEDMLNEYSMQKFHGG